MSLKKYKEKRDFNKTSEPEGKIERKKGKNLRFVIQYHKATTTHYDFRLEWQGVLLSWAVPKGVSYNTKVKRLAVKVEDHPLDYINFKGIIPKGNYGAGTVEIFDKGTYIPLLDFEEGLKKGHLKFFLKGKECKGEWSLVKTDEKNWILIKGKDEFASDKKVIKTENKKNPFKKISPKLASLKEDIPSGKNWLFEIKYDGYRIIAYKENGKVKMLSRNFTDYTLKFKSLCNSIKTLVKDSPMVLDGEVVVFDENGKSDFGLLQQNIKSKKNNFAYVVFDILAFNGEDLTNKPLIERKEILKKVMENCPSNLVFSSFVIGKGKESFSLAKKLNLEGIVAKEINSKYNEKRDADWLKIKCYKRQEFVIGGYTTTDKNKNLSAILVGYYEKNKLIYAGKVGTGFNEKSKKELNKLFKNYVVTKCPFSNKEEDFNSAIWLKPTLVAEVQFAELTKENLLRQPSFIGLREDKSPKQVVLENENSK